MPKPTAFRGWVFLAERITGCSPILEEEHNVRDNIVRDRQMYIQIHLKGEQNPNRVDILKQRIQNEPTKQQQHEWEETWEEANQMLNEFLDDWLFGVGTARPEKLPAPEESSTQQEAAPEESTQTATSEAATPTQTSDPTNG